jgi:hypothetical protein
VTLAVATRDAELRAALAAADRFDLACRLLPGPTGSSPTARSSP